MKLLVESAEKKLFQMDLRMGERDEKVDLFFLYSLQYLLFIFLKFALRLIEGLPQRLVAF